MAEQRNRYPGAQPFSDDDFSRKVFFGREKAARVLDDKILANHMVIVYARSGLGKTSLLQAGVAPKLREEGFLPLFARVNDTNIGPFRALLETIPGEAERQHVEYLPGRPESLWSFFKTAEFWREDLLLTPVLILDQFEELFTLQSEQARAEFLNELSYLTRGVRPPSDDETASGVELSEHPPVVNIVLSLREDYLGFLEEAAEHIPQILDARFRLRPLDLDAAQEAIVGPAGVTDPGLETRPFALDHTAVAAILDYLSHSAHTPVIGETRHYVEPFQLQLICRRMEQIADARQRESDADLTITMADLGGEAGLTQTLRDFYREAIESLPDRRSRRASRRLCEEYLISPEGRRLSLEENELARNLGLPTATLGRLVASRLLRAESRSESTYYELSHDALVEPILESRRTKAQVMGTLGIGAGALLFLPSLLGLLATPFMGYDMATSPYGGVVEGALTAGVSFVFLLVIVVSSATLLRGSARSMLRYRRAREPAMRESEPRPRGSFVVGLSALFGGAAVALIGLVELLEVAAVVFGPVGGWVRAAASWLLAPAERADEVIGRWVRLDTVVYLVAAAATLIIGWRLCRWGIYRLAGIRSGRFLPAPQRLSRSARLYAASRLLLGGVALVSAVMMVGFVILRAQCSDSTSGSMPGWVPDALFNVLAVDCSAGYSYGVAGNPLLDFLVFTALLLVALPALRRGIWAARQAFSSASANRRSRVDSAEQFSKGNGRPTPFQESSPSYAPSSTFSLNSLTHTSSRGSGEPLPPTGPASAAPDHR